MEFKFKKPMVEYAFDADQVEFNCSLGNVLIQDYGTGSLHVTLLMAADERMVFAPSFSSNHIVITTDKKFRKSYVG